MLYRQFGPARKATMAPVGLRIHRAAWPEGSWAGRARGELVEGGLLACERDAPSRATVHVSLVGYGVGPMREAWNMLGPSRRSTCCPPC